MWPRIEKDDIIIFGSYFALNPALRKKVCELVEFAKERKAIIYYDPNFRDAHAHEAVKLMPSVLENLEYADLVKGSADDFNNLFHVTDPQKIYTDHIKFYCPNFICTLGSKGVKLFCEKGDKHFATTPVTPVSTIGAGDSFNAGVLFGLLKHDITLDKLYSLTPEEWEPIVRYGREFAATVCCSMDNYITPEFAYKYSKIKQTPVRLTIALSYIYNKISSPNDMRYLQLCSLLLALSACSTHSPDIDVACEIDLQNYYLLKC